MSKRVKPGYRFTCGCGKTEEDREWEAIVKKLEAHQESCGKGFLRNGTLNMFRLGIVCGYLPRLDILR